ncbi:MAG: ABC transporter substrate-binding protein [Massiliimalia sp.]|jgi:multiple sugar transport system substrate-binding protein
MKNKKAITAMLLASVLTAGTLTACGGNSDSKNTSGSTSGGSGGENTVNVWTWEPYENQKEVIADFNKAHPEIEVTFTTIDSADMPMKVQTALASDSEIGDVIWSEVSQRGKMMALDCWEDLEAEPYNANREELLDFMVPVSVTPSGTLAGIEVSPPVAGLAYKRDLAKEYLGTDDPEELEAMLGDWDSFIAKGEEVRDKSNGSVYMFTNCSAISSLIRHQNQEPFVKDGTLNLEASLGETIDRAIEMKQKGIVDNIENNTPAADAAWSGSNHIFFLCATWSPTWEIKAKDENGSGNWGFINPPGGGCLSGGTVVCIPKAAENKEAAWEYIKWNYLSEEGAVSNRDHLDYFSVYKPVYEDETFYSRPDEFFGGQDVLKAFAQDLIPTMSVPREVTKYDTEVINALDVAMTEIDKSDKGNVSADDLMADMEKDILNKAPDLKG